MGHEWYRIYQSLGDQKKNDGKTLEVIERSYGCNGAEHAVSLHMIFYNERGNVEYADDLTTFFLGFCDGSCLSERDKGHGGFFLSCSDGH